MAERTTPKPNQPAQKVLVFNKHGKLSCITHSAMATSSLMQGTTQGVSAVALGHRETYLGWYLRYLQPNIQIDIEDLGVLTVDEYDDLCDNPLPRKIRRAYTRRQPIKKRQV